MRLVSLEVSGFRAFPTSAHFNLDADTVVVTGANGTGKTSLFDAILWSLTGRIRRFEDRDGGVLSLYSKSGEARVSLRMRDSSGAEWRAIRSTDGDHERFTLETEDGSLEGPSGELRLMEKLWPSAVSTLEGAEVFETVITRSVYLQQDLIRQFLESDTEEERFRVVGELVGAGRLTELQRELERARNAWTRGRTELERRVNDAKRLAEQLRAQLERLAQESPEKVEDLTSPWNEWWDSMSTLGVTMERPPFGSSRAPLALEEALQALQANRRIAERKRSAAESLLGEMRDQPVLSESERHQLGQLHAEVATLESTISATRDRLAEAQALAAEERRRQLELSETRAEFRTLAALALRHLTDRCPVCQQEYDVPATRARLEALVGESPQEASAPTADAAKEVAAELAASEKRLAHVRADLSEPEFRAEQADRWQAELPGRLSELGIEEGVTDPVGAVEALAEEHKARAVMLSELYRRGEQLTLVMTRATEQAQRVDLTQQLRQAEQVLASATNELSAHTRTRDVATKILEGIREAGQEAVALQVKRIEPLVERIYARIDPHPGFTQVKLLTAFYRRRGQISARVADPQAAFPDQDPLPVFSSSQLNALAASLFLGLNLGVPTIPLEAALLDDPLQSLDDVNLLGLVDTLRRTRTLRQLIVSTHDPRFAALLERKLRPVGDAERTIIIAFEDWTRDGPIYSQQEIPIEPVDYRVAAA